MPRSCLYRAIFPILCASFDFILPVTVIRGFSFYYFYRFDALNIWFNTRTMAYITNGRYRLVVKVVYYGCTKCWSTNHFTYYTTSTRIIHTYYSRTFLSLYVWNSPNERAWVSLYESVCYVKRQISDWCLMMALSQFLSNSKQFSKSQQQDEYRAVFVVFIGTAKKKYAIAYCWFKNRELRKSSNECI